ncbi:hypothetical protein BOX15_Mlig030493g1 [Macrostomum lignano]|uniref:Mitochondrial uncoupling protein 4 n=2 Tax=Macrostomum lignano TaxID=282301 RepID=A0A1I8GJJ2_9PLAT|nr:hypothetical protein BOX15_Mlig030493g1 [Macrostomum lignano]
MSLDFYNISVRYALSCCAAAIAETATYPLDLTKTRLQITNEQLLAGSGPGKTTGASPLMASSAGQKRVGMLRTAYNIATEEGPTQLFRGLCPAVARHFVYTGCRTAFYEATRENVLGRDRDGRYAAWKSAVGGLAAGGLAQFFASPADLVKVAMQTEGRRRLLGQPARYHSGRDALRQLVRSGGLLGLWKGWLPNVQRACLVNMADMMAYDQSKRALLRHTGMPDSMLLHACASVCSGLLAAILGTPADLVKTRVMNDSSGHLYRGSLDCLVQTVKHEGFFALYKGFVPIWMRMAPWSLTFWVSYEEIRRITGLSSF